MVQARVVLLNKKIVWNEWNKSKQNNKSKQKFRETQLEEWVAEHEGWKTGGGPNVGWGKRWGKTIPLDTPKPKPAKDAAKDAKLAKALAANDAELAAKKTVSFPLTEAPPLTLGPSGSPFPNVQGFQEGAGMQQPDGMHQLVQHQLKIVYEHLLEKKGLEMQLEMAKKLEEAAKKDKYDTEMQQERARLDAVRLELIKSAERDRQEHAKSLRAVNYQQASRSHELLTHSLMQFQHNTATAAPGAASLAPITANNPSDWDVLETAKFLNKKVRTTVTQTYTRYTHTQTPGIFLLR